MSKQVRHSASRWKAKPQEGQLPSLQEETTKRTSDVPLEPLASPNQRRSANDEDEDDDDDDDDQGEDKKSPWQKREERPLMAFNIK